MTTFDLRTLRLRSGDQSRERVEIELQPLVLGGQTYEPQPNTAPAELTVDRPRRGERVAQVLAELLVGECALDVGLCRTRGVLHSVLGGCHDYSVLSST